MQSLRAVVGVRKTVNFQQVFAPLFIGRANFASLGRPNSSNREPSPYSILQLKPGATKDEIKTQFRRLAKKYHPDLNPAAAAANTNFSKMAEIVEAYDILLDDDFHARVGSSRVSLACELNTIQELRLDPMYDVHAVKVLFAADDKEHSFSLTAGEDDSTQQHVKVMDGSVIQGHHPQEDVINEVFCHEGDSVSDLKRRCQYLFANEWNLHGRTVDRDNVATGFELIANGLVLSYHLFLGTYGIKNNDVLYAVVLRHAM